MSVTVEYRVTENYPDQAPEQFGYIWLQKRPSVGDTIMLKWLDGRDAYRVRVTSVDDFDLEVERITEGV